MKQVIRKYIGLDIHKETIAIGIAEEGRGEAQYFGEVRATYEALAKVLRKLGGGGVELVLCYEAGPCGYAWYRWLRGQGYGCTVVAPSLIPRKPGERQKTDRRDALSLARLHRAGELTGVWVPDEEQEALRDLTRAREDLKGLERISRQRLNAFLLRHGKRYEGKSRWTQAHFRWLERVQFSHPSQQVVFQEYVDLVKSCRRRVAELERQMVEALQSWSLREVAEALMALRGVSLITAMTILAELGDLTRFDSPRELMGYLGLVPSEHSSGASRRQGGITRTGNSHVRRVLVEAAWNYRHMARKTPPIERRAEKTSAPVQAIAWAAQTRLCGRYRRLAASGKVSKQVTTAVARELAGFIWAIACEVGGKAHGSRALT